MAHIKHTIALLVLSLGASMGSAASAQTLSYTTVDLGAGSVRAMNDSGQVTGLIFGDQATTVFYSGANGAGMTTLAMPNGSTYGAPRAIDNEGRIVGGYAAGGVGADGSLNDWHGFATQANGQGITDLVFPANPVYTDFQAINAKGQIAGYGPNQAVVTDTTGSTWQTIASPDWQWSGAHGINDSGQVVGEAFSISGNDVHAFIANADGSEIRDLGTLGGASSTANAINNQGLVVGNSLTASGLRHAFVTGANGVGMVDLGTLGIGINSIAYGINNAGQVVGYSDITDEWFGEMHAFVTGNDGQGMIDLNSMVSLSDGETLRIARAINNNGQILADSSLGHTYLLTPSKAPVPEVASSLMMLIGLGGLGFVTRRKVTASARA